MFLIKNVSHQSVMVTCIAVEFNIKISITLKNWHAWNLVHGGCLIDTCCIKEWENQRPVIPVIAAFLERLTFLLWACYKQSLVFSLKISNFSVLYLFPNFLPPFRLLITSAYTVGKGLLSCRSNFSDPLPPNPHTQHESILHVPHNYWNLTTTI